MRRVVITGLGAVTPAGLTCPATWDALVAGRSAIGPIEIIPTERLIVKIAAQCKTFDIANYMTAKQSSMMDRISQFAVVAGREAIADAGLTVTPEIAETAAVILGVGVGGMNTLDDSFFQMYAQNKQRCHPFTIPRLMTSAPASQISMDLGLHGIAYTIASACASGTHAIGVAARAIRYGETDIAITGGAEACVTVGTLGGWEALRVLSFDTCRPFSKNRSGLVLGEGCAILVIEELEHARARGARIYAEIAGFGANADAGDLTSPDPANIVRAMQLALRDARLTPENVGYVNAHGTGTQMNDLVEGGAIRAVFADAPLPLVSANKGVLGHSLGAAGAIEAMATALTLHHQLIPPTANCNEPDPAIGLDVVPGEARAARLSAAISNSFAFGGLNAVLALREAPG